MRQPEKITCDLCGAVIAHESRIVRIDVPMTADLRKEVVEHVTRSMPKGVLQVVPVDRIVPDRWPLECCGCVLALLPMLGEKVAEDVRRHLTQSAGASGRPQPVERFEDL